jgi:hypothetical protein
MTPASSKPLIKLSPSLPAPSTAIFLSFNIALSPFVVAMITVGGGQRPVVAREPL